MTPSPRSVPAWQKTWNTSSAEIIVATASVPSAKSAAVSTIHTASALTVSKEGENTTATAPAQFAKCGVANTTAIASAPRARCAAEHLHICAESCVHWLNFAPEVTARHDAQR